MNRDEAIKALSKAGNLSVEHAKDLYDTIVPKPVVPQYVADWYEKHKGEFYLNLHRVVRDFFGHVSGTFNENPIDYDFGCWYYNNNNALQILVNMHQFGYDVEKEPKYIVKLKNKIGNDDYLVDTGDKSEGFRFYSSIYKHKRIHTRKKIEEAGFGWVFNCEGIEIEEVE